MEVLIHLIQKGSISRAAKAVKNMMEDIQKINELTKTADKSPAGWNTVLEYLSDDLASNSEDDKKLKAAEARALRKQEFKVKNNYVSYFRQINTREETRDVPSSTKTKPISSITSTITRDTSSKSIKNSSSGQDFFSDADNWVTTEKNVDLTKKQKDECKTDKYDFLFNSGSVNCGQCGCLYENINYKYQDEKQKK